AAATAFLTSAAVPEANSPTTSSVLDGLMLRTALVPATCSPPMKLLKTATMLSLEKPPAVRRGALRPIDGQGAGRRQAVSRPQAMSAASGRPPPLVGILEQPADAVARHRTRVEIRALCRDLCGAIQILLLQPDVLQGERRADLCREIVQSARGIRRAERAGDPRHHVRRGVRIVGGRVRQHDHVGLGMRQVEAAAERVAELVM